MLNFDYIFVCGDIHGELDVIPNFLKANDLKNCAIIVVGDFGVGFDDVIKEDRRMNHFNNRLKKYNSAVFVVRGNHDDPNYFNGELDINKKHVKFVNDYDVLEINGWNILCVGGATSIDRTNRKRYILGKGRDWWKDEIFVYDENKANNLKDIDFVVTHTAPHFAYPYVKIGLDYWINRDIHLFGDLEKERSEVTKLYEHLIINGNKILRWYYGHFHMSKTFPYDDTIFTCLDINETKELFPLNNKNYD